MATSRDRYHHGELRTALIATGLELTRAGGPQALRLREVARQLGVSPNAAYRHFASHAALLGAVAAEIQDAMARTMRDQMAADPGEDAQAGALVRLRGVGLGYVEFALTEPGWFQLAFFPPENVGRPDGRPASPLLLLHEALDELVRTGMLSADRRAGAEWSCWSTVHGFAELVIHGPLRGHDPQEVRPLAERAIDDIIAGVVRDAVPSRPEEHPAVDPPDGSPRHG